MHNDCRRTRFDADLPGLRPQQAGDHAYRCLPVVLRVRAVPHRAQAQAGRLLRLLLIWQHALSIDSGERKGRRVLPLILPARVLFEQYAAIVQSERGAIYTIAPG